VRFIDCTLELYAHAIAIEREAAERYAGFAERMEDEGQEDLARAFGLLASAEAAHLATLLNRTAGLALPTIAPGRYQWLDAQAPETAARAREMAADEEEHIELLAKMLGELPAGSLDTTLIFTD
jgi:rubrerythrin